MSTETTNSKPKTSKTVLILSIVLIGSLVFNGIQFSNTSQKVVGQKVEYISYMSAMDSICTASINMDIAKDWIALVNKEGIMFNNKSIFICKDAINAMIEERPDYTGIFVRRGMDADDKMIHDLGWVGVPEGSSPAPKAFLLEWQSCACPPCCGDDTSDYRDYTSVSHGF